MTNELCWYAWRNDSYKRYQDVQKRLKKSKRNPNYKNSKLQLADIPDTLAERSINPEDARHLCYIEMIAEGYAESVVRTVPRELARSIAEIIKDLRGE